MTSIRLLGLDIGGTSSRARVVADGVVEAEARAASASLTAAGPDSAAAALGELLAELPAGRAVRRGVRRVGGQQRTGGARSSWPSGWPR